MGDGILFLGKRANPFHIVEPSSSGVLSVINSLIYDYKLEREMILKGVENLDLNTISAMNLIIIANNLNVDPENLFMGNVHKTEIVSQLKMTKGEKGPDHFMENPFSSTTSLVSLLEIAEKFGRRQYLLKKLQINESYLESHKPISIFACRDALSAMKGLFGLDEIAEVGKRNAIKFCAGEFGDAMNNSSRKLDVLDGFIEHSQLIEKNWDYNIVKFSKGKVVLESVESRLMTDHLEGEIFSNLELNTWRLSFLEEVIHTFSNQRVKCSQISEIGKKGKVLFQLEYS
jgi:hypothetical protein